MTILIVGGTGNTGTRLASILHAAGQSTMLASRSGTVPSSLANTDNVKGVKFNWFDPATFENPFTALPSSFSPIDRMYLVVPNAEDQLKVTKGFIDLAATKGVKRFVLLSAASCEKGGPAMGKIHEYLDQKGVEYFALRPTWFMDNFKTMFLKSIVEKNEIGTTTKDGRVAFISSDDIAEAAKDALLDEKPVRTDYVIVGPDLFTYDEVTEIISEIVGRKIVHKPLTEEEAIAFWTEIYSSDDMAKMLVMLEGLIAAGVAEAITKYERVIVGKTHFRDFIRANKDLFVAKA